MAWWTWGPLTGALVKLIPARVVNVSRHGCLLETSSPLPAGAVGSLEIERGGQKHVEAIRVCRTAERLRPTGRRRRYTGSRRSR